MNKYLSERGAGEITAQQYIMEQFLILLAKQEHSALPDYFWKLDKYKKLWKRHIRDLVARIKEYGEVPIIRALKDKKLSRLYSFSKKSAFIWKPVLDKYKKEYELEQLNKDIVQKEWDIDINPNNRQNINNKNKLSQLKELDF
jgi:hypothetical protein